MTADSKKKYSSSRGFVYHIRGCTLKVKFEEDEKGRWIGLVFMLQGQKKDPKWHCPKANGQTQGHNTGIQLCEKGREEPTPEGKKRGFLSVPGPMTSPAGFSFVLLPVSYTHLTLPTIA